MATRKASSKGINVILDLAEVEALARRVAQIDSNTIGPAVVSTLNEVVDRTDELARERMLRDINLEEPYTRKKMRVTKATPGKPEASIAVADEPIPLGRFADIKTVRVPTKTPANKLKGFRQLWIPRGTKQQGVQVEVLKGQTNSGFVPRGFILPLKAGNVPGGNGFGLFARNKSGKKLHRYGPSVYQLFSFQAGLIGDEVTDDLENTLVEKIDAIISEGLE